jgi:hypothetical protein
VQITDVKTQSIQATKGLHEFVTKALQEDPTLVIPNGEATFESLIKLAEAYQWLTSSAGRHNISELEYERSFVHPLLSSAITSDLNNRFACDG